MTTTTATATTPETLDLYREVHKGLRKALFSLCEHAGSLDPADDEARKSFVVRFAEVEKMLTQHHEHEDTAFMGDLIAAKAPDLIAEVEAGHEAIVDAVDTLRRAVISIGDGGGDADELYDLVAAFVVDYLSHMAFEEHQVMPALAAASTFDELLAVQIGVRTTALPTDVAMFMRWALPAMNPDERTAMLGGMKANAPAEVFDIFWATAGEVLTTTELAVVAARIGDDVAECDDTEGHRAFYW